MARRYQIGLHFEDHWIACQLQQGQAVLVAEAGDDLSNSVHDLRGSPAGSEPDLGFPLRHALTVDGSRLVLAIDTSDRRYGTSDLSLAEDLAC